MKKSSFKIINSLCIIICISTLSVSSAFAVNLRSWDKQIDNGNKRFKILSSFADEAVLDKETQLVWMREPFGVTTWLNAKFICAGTKVGGRMGWRLPSLSEFTSVLDPNNFDPALSDNHPFIDVGSSIYWTATVSTGAGGLAAWGVSVVQGQVHFALSINTNRRIWCVRSSGPLSSY